MSDCRCIYQPAHVPRARLSLLVLSEALSLVFTYAGLAVTSHVVDHCIVEFRYRLSEQPQADIRHVWYYCWKDFSVPRSEDRVAIR